MNIAAFEAYYWASGAWVWESRVQVGKTYRQTPVFTADIAVLHLFERYAG